MIRHRALVLAGSDDTAVPVSNARILARLIPRASLRVVRGAGHLPLFERPDVVTDLVAQLLREGHTGPARRGRARHTDR